MTLRLYLARRALMVVPLLLGLSILTFTISRLVPGDPVGLAAGPQATVEIREALRKQFGLDQPLPVQYATYITGILRGDWGQSLYTRRGVIDSLRVYFPATLELTLAAVILATGVGVPAGVISAMYRNRLPDHIARVISLFLSASRPSGWP